MLESVKKSLSWIGGAVLICSFLGALIFGVFDSSKDSIIVRFKSLKPIEKFDLESKAASSNNTQHDRLELIKELVEERIVEDFISSNEIKVSDEVLKQFLSKNLMFKSTQGGFDDTKLKNYLARTGMSEFAFMQHLRKNLTTQCVFQSFCSIPSSKFLLTAFQKRNLETKKIILANLDFNRNVQIPTATEKDLREIYLLYQKEFLLPEVRSLHYCAIAKPIVQQLSKEEILAYFKNHRSAFRGKKLEKVEKKIAQILVEEKKRNLESQINQSIEACDYGKELEVLDQIAKRFSVQKQSVANVSLAKLSEDALFGSVSTSIFKASNKCLGDPLITKDFIIVWFLSDIQPTKIQSFEHARGKVIEKFTNIQRKIANQRRIEAFVSDVNNSKQMSKQRFEEIALSYGVDCSKHCEVNNWSNANLPYFMLESLDSTAVHKTTPVFSDQEKFFVAFVESKGNLYQKLIPLEQLEQKLRQNLLVEIYGYLYRKAQPTFVAKITN
jgi:hypothetical protein